MNQVLSNLKSRIVQHIIFWAISFYAIGSYFSISNELKTIDFIYSAFFHIPLVILVYINLRYQIPTFLKREKYLIYLLLSGFTIAFAYFLHQLIFDILIPILPTDFYMVSFADMGVLMTIFSGYWGLSTLLRLSKSWYLLQQAEKEKLSLELNSLKTQINPHFLFNSLNSMYSLARKKDDKTPDAILRLSNLMRYMIYEVADQVPLSKEVEAIQDYLDLQRLRLPADTKINFEINGEIEHRTIAPLLFFPLIENSFKHGLKGTKDENFVDIKLTNNESLTFEISNNTGKVDPTEDSKYGGIGLENVKKRMELIYGQKGNFEVKETNGTFTVLLKIEWND